MSTSLAVMPQDRLSINQVLHKISVVSHGCCIFILLATVVYAVKILYRNTPGMWTLGNFTLSQLYYKEVCNIKAALVSGIEGSCTVYI